MAVLIPEQDNLRPGKAHRRDAANQESVGSQHGQIHADVIAAAEIDLNGAPPVGWFAQDDAREFEIPAFLLLPAEEFSKAVVFAGDLLRVLRLNLPLHILAAQSFV